MKRLHLLGVIISISILLTGCYQTKIVSDAKVQSTYQIVGCEYKDNYYFCSREGNLKVFNEKTKKSDYLCKKNKCIHDREDKTCISYAFGATAFVAKQEHLYVFANGFSSPELNRIERINLKDGTRTLYSAENNFGAIYNAFLYDNKVFFSDWLTDGGCAIKVFDIEKKTIELITNKQEANYVSSWISGISDGVLYFREDYYGEKFYMRDDTYPDYTYSMGIPSWYNEFIVSTSLFTYNLNTKVSVQTTKDITQFGNTYYDKGFYFVDRNNDIRRIDWGNGENEIVVGSDDISAEIGEEIQLHQFGYNDKLGLTAFRKGEPTETGVRGAAIIGKRFIYDVALKELQSHTIDDDAMQFVTPESELNDGFIVAFDRKPKRQVKRAYISKDDYYSGKMNLIELD